MSSVKVRILEAIKKITVWIGCSHSNIHYLVTFPSDHTNSKFSKIQTSLLFQFFVKKDNSHEVINLSDLCSSKIWDDLDIWGSQQDPNQASTSSASESTTTTSKKARPNAVMLRHLTAALPRMGKGDVEKIMTGGKARCIFSFHPGARRFWHFQKSITILSPKMFDFEFNLDSEMYEVSTWIFSKLQSKFLKKKKKKKPSRSKFSCTSPR